MFTAFFYVLKAHGLKVSMNEWLTLMRALDGGFSKGSLTGFYELCRAVLVKSEADYDRFDVAFAEFFRGIETPPDLPDAFWQWLEAAARRDADDLEALRFASDPPLELDELMRRFEERRKEQTARHDGGNYWIGTGGTSTMGHGGYNARGIRAGGEGRHGNAVRVAGERKFRDFRQDSILDVRQFQTAFRKLRQFSAHTNERRTELDVDATIRRTGDNAGRLSLVWRRPRRNMIKLLVLFDSDGSMSPYGRLCASLFRAVDQANHFKDLKVFYFHNCVYEHLYTTPVCRRGEWTDTEWVLNNLNGDYRLILVGDGTMAPSELLREGGNATIGLYNRTPGAEWLKRIRRQYERSIWLNPIRRELWDRVYGSHTLKLIGEIFPMYELTVDGLEASIKKLMAGR